MRSAKVWPLDLVVIKVRLDGSGEIVNIAGDEELEKLDEQPDGLAI